MDGTRDTTGVLMKLKQFQLRSACGKESASEADRPKEQFPILLLTGAEGSWEVVSRRLEELPPKTVFLSQGANFLNQAAPLPIQHKVLNGKPGEWLDFKNILHEFPALDVGLLTRTTLAKVALGIADSAASALVLRYVRAGRVIRAWYQEGAQGAEVAIPNQAILSGKYREYLQTWKRLGVQFADFTEIYPLPQPGREIRRVEGQAQQRLWTLDKVQGLSNGDVVILGSRDIVTPLAQDALRSKHIEVVREGDDHANR